MTAMACMRIVIDPARGAAGGEDLAAMVSKVALAFLETRWTWPRRYGEIAPYAFLLADPRETHLDPAELVALSEQLEFKLFGSSGRGAVSLATLEGDSDAVTRFAAVDPKELREVLAKGGQIDGLVGRISEISCAGVRVVSPPGEAGPVRPVTPAAAAAAGPPRIDPVPDPEIEASFRGVWCAPKRSFVGSGVAARRIGSRTAYSVMEGLSLQPGAAAAPEFDTACLRAAPSVLVGSKGLLFVPISFSSAVHRQTRDSYGPALEGLPHGGRPRLAAAVYDVPRGPSFPAIEQLRAFLKPYFSFIDLQTSDPDFQIGALSVEAVTSVTLCLPDADGATRAAAARRFVDHRETYKKLHIWQAVTNLRSTGELAACLKMRVPFLSGRAVSDNLWAPADPVPFAPEKMPLRDHAARPDRGEPDRDAAFL